ncbi:MarR family winged helix-turn-helix transcriptional regulator [Halovulum sp. GXIMD14794]
MSSHFNAAILELDPEVQVFMGVTLLYRNLAERMELIDLGVELSKSEKHIVIRLGRARRMGDLARDLMALPSTVTAVADGLEVKGLAVRERDPDDRRAWLLKLTDEGTALRARMLREAGNALRAATGLPDEDIETLAALMRKASERLLENGFPEDLKLCKD